MKKILYLSLAAIWIGSLFLAYRAGFSAGFSDADQKAKTAIDSMSDSMEYTAHITIAKMAGGILLDARAGNTTSVVQRLERMTDLSLSRATELTLANTPIRAMPQGPWADIKKDRLSHPRPTSEDKNNRVGNFLDLMSKKNAEEKATDAADKVE